LVKNSKHSTYEYFQYIKKDKKKWVFSTQVSTC
jgi:hypothetical protein